MQETESTQPGGEPNANSAASPAGVQPSSFDRDQLRKELKAEILAELKGDKSLTQSMKDQTIEQIKKDKGFKTFMEPYREMKARGMSEKEIEQEFRLQELEAERTHQPAPVAPGSATSDGTSDLEDLLPALGFEPDDADVLRIMGQPTTAIAKANELAKLSQRRKSSPSPAAAAQPASAPQPTADKAALEREYREKLNKISGNPSQIADLKKQYRGKGLEVW